MTTTNGSHQYDQWYLDVGWTDNNGDRQFQTYVTRDGASTPQNSYTVYVAAEIPARLILGMKGLDPGGTRGRQCSWLTVGAPAW